MSEKSSAVDLWDGFLPAGAGRRLDELYVTALRCSAALRTMHGLPKASRSASSHHGFVLLGKSGAGKTATLLRLEALSHISSKDAP